MRISRNTGCAIICFSPFAILMLLFLTSIDTSTPAPGMRPAAPPVTAVASDPLVWRSLAVERLAGTRNEWRVSGMLENTSAARFRRASFYVHCFDGNGDLIDKLTVIVEDVPGPGQTRRVQSLEWCERDPSTFTIHFSGAM